MGPLSFWSIPVNFLCLCFVLNSLRELVGFISQRVCCVFRLLFLLCFDSILFSFHRCTGIPWYPWGMGSRTTVDTKVCGWSGHLNETALYLHVTYVCPPIYFIFCILFLIYLFLNILLFMLLQLSQPPLCLPPHRPPPNSLRQSPNHCPRPHSYTIN